MSHGFSRFAVQQMARHGAMGYIRKPVSIEQLDLFLTDRLKYFAKQIGELEVWNQSLSDESSEDAA